MNVLQTANSVSKDIILLLCVVTMQIKMHVLKSMSSQIQNLFFSAIQGYVG